MRADEFAIGVGFDERVLVRRGGIELDGSVYLDGKRQLIVQRRYAWQELADVRVELIGSSLGEKFIAAISLLVVFKNSLNQRTLPGLTLIARYSLPIYGFHALFIHYLRTHHYDDMSRPWLDLPWVFGLTLGGSLLLGMALKRVDTRHFVS